MVKHIDKETVRLGVDIGGTFTDLVLEKKGTFVSTKILTTPDAPENAIITGMKNVCNKAGIKPHQIETIIHGTTLATNALIERRGAKTALITTKGFRDVIEMRTESRFEQYDLNLILPEPLISREKRYVVHERVNASGKILIPLLQKEIEILVDKIKKAGFESVAIGLIHSYLNDKHEKLIRETIRKKMPYAMVSISSEVSPQMREYERFNTVIVNAYIKPLMKCYLSRLKEKLKAENVSSVVFLMHSGGGIISLENASEFPVRLIESGPAGGAIFAANLAERYNLKKALSFDMGGTTAKICLLKDHTPKTNRVFEVARTYRFKKGSGMPISIPVIDMVEIGAGGGSIATVDSMNQIRVGPLSSGSDPGPACYGLGGKKPTVTDADLVLGKLDSNCFAGGSIKLVRKTSEIVLEQHLGRSLKMNSESSAYGISEVVDENMANASRVHAVENGEDLSEYTMIAFGGAAPLHAGRICEKLGIKRLLIPKGAGVGSALGFLYAPFSFETNRSIYMCLSRFNEVKAAQIFRSLAKEAKRFVRNCNINEKIDTEFKVYMRYIGQGWEIPIVISADHAQNPTSVNLSKLFETEYQSLFGRSVNDLDLEITIWSANAKTHMKNVGQMKSVLEHKLDISYKKRMVYDTNIGRMLEASIIERDKLKLGQLIEGPAIITEDETTIFLPSNRKAITQQDGCIDITIKT